MNQYVETVRGVTCAFTYLNYDVNYLALCMVICDYLVSVAATDNQRGFDDGILLWAQGK